MPTSGKCHVRGKKVQQTQMVNFRKHMYGRQVKHSLKSLSDFDPRSIEYRGKATSLLKTFLGTVKGKGLGVSVLVDEDLQVWANAPTEQPNLTHTDELVERVKSYKRSLRFPQTK